MIFTSAKAYSHSFSPISTGEYVIRLVEQGYDPRHAVNQAAIEHGTDQAEEFAAACRANLTGGKPARTRNGWLQVARRAIKAMGETGAEVTR